MFAPQQTQKKEKKQGIGNTPSVHTPAPVKTEPAKDEEEKEKSRTFGYGTDITNFQAIRNWPAFYATQKNFQQSYKPPKDVESTSFSEDIDGVGVTGVIEKNVDTDISFTTFGMEYEMIPYTNDNAIANTAHIELATGERMPVAPFTEKLVTDSDNIIEYVTPVFVVPFDKTGITGITAYIEKVTGLLSGLRKDIAKKAPKTFDKLVQMDEMQFTSWSINKSIELSHREIDEKTNVMQLIQARNWTNKDIGDIKLGYDKKNPKHDGLRDNETLGASMQSTVLLPLNIVAKLAKGNIDQQNKPAAVGKLQRQATKQVQPSQKHSKEAGLEDVIISHFKDSASPEFRNLVALFCQKLDLSVNAPHAVTFQAHYQKNKFLQEQGLPKETLKDLDKRYGEETNEYATAERTKTTASPNNYHNAHSGIKDRLSIWTRAYLTDILKAIFQIIGSKGQPGEFCKLVVAYYGKSEDAKEILNKLFTSVHSTHEGGVRKAKFLNDNPEYPDLRQDTLREVTMRNGQPWVQVEIRDLKADTLKNLVAWDK